MGQPSAEEPDISRPWPKITLTLLLLLLPLLASAYRVRGVTAERDDVAQEVSGKSHHHGPFHSHGSVLQKVKIPCSMPAHACSLVYFTQQKIRHLKELSQSPTNIVHLAWKS